VSVVDNAKLCKMRTDRNPAPVAPGRGFACRRFGARRRTGNERKPRARRGFQGIDHERKSRDQGALDAPILFQVTNQAKRGSRPRLQCAGRAKDSDEQQVTLHGRKTTTKRSQRREHDQLPHPRVHLQDTFHFALILEAPRPAGRGSATSRDLPQRPGRRSCSTAGRPVMAN